MAGRATATHYTIIYRLEYDVHHDALGVTTPPLSPNATSPILLLSFETYPDTSLTNMFAFILGSSSTLPAVEYFCFYAATAIFFDFCLQVPSASRIFILVVVPLRFW